MLDAGREDFDAPTMFVSSEIVMLAAGTLGTTEILLRSKDNGLPLSDRLGHNFTGNGDLLGFGYNNDIAINGIGFGDRKPGKQEPVGPCITGIIDARNQPELNEGMVIEDGSIPGGTSALVPEALAAGAVLLGKDTDRGILDFFKELFRTLVSLVRRSRHGAVRNTQTYLVMTHDDARDRMHMKGDRLRIDWPGVGSQPNLKSVNDRLEEATRALGGTYVKNPISTKLTGHDLITVHPLGGCIMAQDAAHGVVNHKGKAFSGTQGSEVFEGLYICDGSVMPRSLGVNPLLTISALAERCCVLLAQDRGWKISYDFPSVTPTPSEPRRLGLQFTEAMKGHISTKVLNDYEKASEQGRQDDSPFEFILTIIANDLDHFIEEASHPARMVGSVTAPALSPNPLTVTDAGFNLFTVDQERPDTRRMKYRMKMISQ